MDKVMVAITAEKHGDKRCEGKILKILEHQIKEVVGTYQKSKTFGFVVPDNKKSVMTFLCHRKSPWGP